MADVSDNFDRANEDPLSNGGLWQKPSWAQDNLLTVSNACYQKTSNLWATAYWVQAFAADSYSQYFVTNSGNYCYSGHLLRIAADLSTNYYAAYLHTFVGAIGAISKTVNGVETILGAQPNIVTNNRTFKFSCTGTTLAVDVTSYAQETRTDSTFSSAGFAAIQRASAQTTNGMGIDDWIGGPLSTTIIRSVFPLFRPTGGMV